MSEKLSTAATLLLNAAADVPLATIPPALHAPLLALENTVLREQLEGRDAEVTALRACVAELQRQVANAKLDAIDRLEARIAELTTEAARREGFIVELEGRLSDALASRPPAKAAGPSERETWLEQRVRELETALQRVYTEPKPAVLAAPATDRCPHCDGAGFASLKQHINYCPKNPDRKPPANRFARARLEAEQGVRVVADDPNWRCATCQSDAFARDLHRPELCVRCAREARAAA